MEYVLLAFDPVVMPDTNETPRDTFIRRFTHYRSMREQVGSRVAVVVHLTPQEEKELFDQGVRRDSGYDKKR